ncbi:LysR substrate-binding domain-containing protein, partial [Rhizobium ruizarguesonis]
TDMGTRFVEAAEKMEQETERLCADLAAGSMAQRGLVRLSAPEGFANFFFAPVLPQFAAQHQHLALELVTIQQIMSLSRKEADLSVVLYEP